MTPLHAIAPQFTDQELLCMANILNILPHYRFRRHPSSKRLQMQGRRIGMWGDVDSLTLRDFGSRRAPLTEEMRHIAMQAFDHA